MKKNILWLFPSIPHYKVSVFEQLIEDCSDIDFYFVGAKHFEGIKDAAILPNTILLSYRKFQIIGHDFFLYKNFWKTIHRINPNVLITSGVNFHFPQTILLYFWYYWIRKRKFIWFTHAKEGNQGIFGKLIRSIFYRNSSMCFPYSNKGKENLLILEVPNYKIQVIGNAIAQEDYGLNYISYYPKKFKNHNTFVIIYSARLSESKRVDLLIDALFHLKNETDFQYKCYIIGEGAAKTVIQKQIETCQLEESIFLVGEQYGQAAAYFFNQAHVLISPGPIGLSIVHAFSYGVGVITSNNIDSHGPEIELITETKNGLFFKENDANDLKDKILQWKKIISEDIDNNIFYACLNTIEDNGYTPIIVSKKIAQGIKKSLSN